MNRPKILAESPLFYAPDVALTNELPPEESQHAVGVLRLREGAVISVTDGKGKLFQATITDADRRRCRLSITSSETPPKPWQGGIHLAVAPTKNLARMEWLLEKATEIGFDSVTLLDCTHSERRTVNTQRLSKIMIAAMKQSQKALLPRLTPLTPFRSFVTTPFSGQRFIAHCHSDATLWGQTTERARGKRPFLGDAVSSSGEALVMIGPEGDFSEEEVNFSLSIGFLPVTLSPSRLRTETAALVAVHILNLRKCLWDT